MTSVGQLVAMKPAQRECQIAALSEPTRLSLAHLASLGIARELVKLNEYQEVLEALTHEPMRNVSPPDDELAAAGDDLRDRNDYDR